MPVSLRLAIPAKVPERLVTEPVLEAVTVQVPLVVFSVPVVPVSLSVAIPANVPVSVLSEPVFVAVSV